MKKSSDNQFTTKLATILEKHNIQVNNGLIKELESAIAQQTTEELTYHTSTDDISSLNKFITNVIDYNTDKEIYQYTGEFLSNIYPDIALIINTYDSANDTLTPLKAFFPNRSIINQAIKIMRVNFEGKPHSTNPNLQKIFKTGKLTKIEGGITEMSEGFYPTTIIKTLETILGVKSVYVIGLIREDNLFACLQFYQFKKSKPINLTYIEALCSQVSILVQRKYYELNLSLNEQLYRSLFDKALNPITVYDLGGKVLMINKFQEEINGVKIDDFIGKNILDLYPTKATAFKERIQTVVQSGKSINFEEFVDSGNEIKWYLNIMHPLRLNSSEINAVQVLSYNISDKKNAEIIIKDNEEKYSAIFQSNFSAIFILNQDGSIIQANNFASKQYQYTTSEILNLNIQQLNIKTEELIYQEKLSKIISNNQNIKFEATHIKKDKTTFSAQVGLSPLLLSSGNFIVVVVRDITEIKETQNSLQKANDELSDALATKSKFLSIIGHDLRGPLNSISSLAQFIEEDISEKEYDSVSQHAKLIQDSAKNTLDLLNNLLLWSRAKLGLEKVNKETLEIATLLQEVLLIVEPIANQKNISIETNIIDIENINADKNMVKTILLNLVSNAIKFTKNSGKIIVQVSIQNNQPLFEVIDSGVGMEQKNVDKLFNLNYNYTSNGTNNEKGTGLGLLLCKEFVEKHEGAIWVKSELDKGSTFLFTIKN